MLDTVPGKQSAAADVAIMERGVGARLRVQREFFAQARHVPKSLR